MKMKNGSDNLALREFAEIYCWAPSHMCQLSQQNPVNLVC